MGIDAWSTHYSSWAAAAGLGSKVAAFVYGAANMIEAAGIPHNVALAIMGVFVASFAGTTMDTATRIERYALTELFSNSPIKIFNNKYVSTAVAVFLAGCLAFSSGGNGKGALSLWPLFGCINQILAALVLTTVTVYLKKRGGIELDHLRHPRHLPRRHDRVGHSGQPGHVHERRQDPPVHAQPPGTRRVPVGRGRSHLQVHEDGRFQLPPPTHRKTQTTPAGSTDPAGDFKRSRPWQTPRIPPPSAPLSDEPLPDPCSPRRPILFGGWAVLSSGRSRPGLLGKTLTEILGQISFIGAIVLAVAVPLLYRARFVKSVAGQQIRGLQTNSSPSSAPCSPWPCSRPMPRPWPTWPGRPISTSAAHSWPPCTRPITTFPSEKKGHPGDAPVPRDRRRGRLSHGVPLPHLPLPCATRGGSWTKLYRAKATERLEWETRELENIFSLLTLGAFVGVQAPPMHITLELLPEMEDELIIMTNRVCMANDPLADLFSMFDGI